jgi:hypothetical protein
MRVEFMYESQVRAITLEDSPEGPAQEMDVVHRHCCSRSALKLTLALQHYDAVRNVAVYRVVNGGNYYA